MRIFSSITAGLLLLFAVLTVGFGAVVLADADSDGSVTCSNTASASYCTGDGAGDSQYQAVGLAFVVGGSAMFLGACVLLAGVTAAGRTVVQAPAPAPYRGGGGTWQGSPRPAASVRRLTGRADRRDPRAAR